MKEGLSLIEIFIFSSLLVIISSSSLLALYHLVYSTVHSVTQSLSLHISFFLSASGLFVISTLFLIHYLYLSLFTCFSAMFRFPLPVLYSASLYPCRAFLFFEMPTNAKEKSDLFLPNVLQNVESRKRLLSDTGA